MKTASRAHLWRQGLIAVIIAALLGVPWGDSGMVRAGHGHPGMAQTDHRHDQQVAPCQERAGAPCAEAGHPAQSFSDGLRGPACCHDVGCPATVLFLPPAVTGLDGSGGVVNESGSPHLAGVRHLRPERPPRPTA